jgi:hypothetical protein
MENPAQTEDTAADPEPGPHYAYRPSLMGAPFEFRLAGDAFHWRKGRIEGHAPYDRIRRIRLSFRPATMQTYRFLAEVWPQGGPKLLISSTSWRSIIEQERLDDAYAPFLKELHRRIAAAGGRTIFDAGNPPLLYWPGVVIFVGISLAMAALTIRAVQEQAWGAAAFIGGFLALFLWQAGNFFRRNRPLRYDPMALPDAVLPRTTKTEHLA